MNRFDDRLSWHFLKIFISPLLAAVTVYVAFRVTLEHRLTTVEDKNESIIRDVSDIKADIHELKSDMKELVRRVK